MNALPTFLILVAVGQEPVAANRDGFLAAMRESAERYRVTTRNDTDEAPATLEDEPLLRWTNPQRGSPDGIVYLWTRKGRPVAALCVYPNNGAFDHEWQSLAESPLEASFPEGVTWKPSNPGLTFVPVPDAPPVADTAQLRLSQMRSLARRFSGWVYKPPETQQIRLLTQPIYRYPDDTPDAIDGAVFAYVQGTDPEVLLLFEARQDADALRWYYAYARMSSVYLEVRDGDRVVWSVEPDWSHDAGRPYMTFLQRVPIPAVPGEAAE
jgi:hypothetical protein